MTMHSLRGLASGSLQILFFALFAVAVAGCGGDSSNDSGNPPPVSGNDEDPQLSPDGELAAKQPLVITFDRSMDPDSLQLAGSLAENAQAEWSSSDTDNDTLTLTPSGYWSAGSQTLTVTVNDSDGDAIDPLEAELNVASAFTSFQEAVIVLGQPDFSSGDSRQGGLGADADTLDLPMGPVAYAPDEDVFFISDNGDSRVLAFNGIPDTNNVPADFVLGQPDFNSSSGATTAATYRNPQWVTTNDGKLIVTDSESRRMLVYNEIPQSGPVDADIVIGQPDMTSLDIRCDQRTTYTTHGHFVTPAGRLFVSDADNNRVLMWNAVPTENYAPADLVLGQPGFESCNAWDEPGGSDDMRAFNHPVAIWSDDERLVITDNENHRVLIWNEFPQANFAEPDVILGQETFDNTAPNDVDQDGVEDSAVSASTMNLPWDVSFHGGQLFVSDYENNRVLIWNGWPQENFQPADIVIGQEDFDANAVNAGNTEPAANTLNGPRGATIIGDRMFITDTRNSRVLIFESQ